MAEYSSSATTKLALINAAGLLFAEHGFESITTRDIAEAANENKGSIHYHFGGKDGLLTAVVEYAAQPWDGDPLGSLLDSRSEALSSVEGQDRLLGELIDLFFETITAKGYPAWCNTLVFRILQKDPNVSEQLFSSCVKPSIGALMRFFSAVAGDSDPAKAYAWSESIISPIVLRVINPNVAKRFLSKGQQAQDYMRYVKEIAKIGALASLRAESQGKVVAP